MNPGITKIIEQYLNNELSEADMKAFEQRLSQNETLQREVDLQKSVHEAAGRGAVRAVVKQTARSYHFRKNLVTSSVIIAVAAAIALSVYVTLKSGREKEFSETTEYSALLDKLDKEAPIDNIPVEYFSLSKEDTVVLSKKGVLLSVPESAFLLNGRPYTGTKIVQWQEAMDAATIVKGGLSTMSGSNLLETQGMFGIKAFTADGKKLDVNPKVGVYVQVPVDELKEGMQLFEGKPGQNGVIDWQNPVPLEKKPVLADMRDLDFYPPGYEAELNRQKWKTGKKSRDSLYLSFEENLEMASGPRHPNTGSVNEKNPYPDTLLSVSLSGKSLFGMYCFTCHQIRKDGTGPALYDVREKWMDRGAKGGALYSWVKNWKKAAENDPYCMNVAKMKPTDMPLFPNLTDEDIDAIFDFVDGHSDHIPPSSVLGFWKYEFNSTILSTRDFEKRMPAIHNTCSKEVLEVYTKNLHKPIYELDEQICRMGFPEFWEFAAERVGRVELSDPHMRNLERFYSRAIEGLKREMKRDRDFARKAEREWNSKMNSSRSSEYKRKSECESNALSEEYELNLKDVCRQLNRSVGFQIHGGGTIYNIDKYVMDATIARQSATITDPETKKTAKIQYNSFSVSINDPGKYGKLFLYLFPHELNSYQRIDPKKPGFFDYALNNIIQYDLAVIGINEDSYAIYTQKGLNKGDLGTVSLQKVTEKEFNKRIEALNSGRNSAPMKIADELSWLSDEKADYKVQRLRKEMAAFRAGLRSIIYPCLKGKEYAPAAADETIDIPQ